MKAHDALASVCRRMRSDFEVTRTLQHNASKGRAREQSIVAEYLGKYLPGHVRVAHSAEVIDTTGAISSECDVVVVDAYTPLLWEQDEAYRVVPVECLHGVVEVKSNLTSAELRDAIEKISAIKRMPKTAYYPQGGAVENESTIYDRTWPYFPTIGAVFGYEGADLDTLATTMVEAQRDLPPEQMIDHVCVLDSGQLLYWHPERGRIEVGACSGAALMATRSENPLALTTVLLQGIWQSAWMPKFKIGDYIPEAFEQRGTLYETGL